MGPFKPSRRGVLKGGFGVAGAGVLGALPRRARAATPAPHYLINVTRRGGWDSLWFHNAVPVSEISDIVENLRPIVSGQAFIHPPPGNILSPYATNGSANPSRSSWSVRFPDSFLSHHPDGVTTLGPGLNFMQPADFANICIWRGLAATGGHNLGNHILQCGGLSGTYPSFSTTIAAQAILNGAARRLNYVQIANSSVDLATSTGAYSQLVQPINIPDARAWTALTSAPSQQLSTQANRDALDRAIADLSKAVSTDTHYRPSTKNVFSSFEESFQGAKNILSSGFGASMEFAATVTFYTDAITQVLNGHVFKTSWFSASGADDLIANHYVDTLAFRFALAEFLVTHDLSTAVDVLAPGAGDFHNTGDNDAMYHLCLYVAYVTLVRRLGSTQSAVQPGSSVLDTATVVMHTEFERHPLISSLDLQHAGEPGADHGDFAASIWLAGKNINTGKVIGDFKRGVSSSRFGGMTYSGIAPYHPLPLDPVTGQVSLTGVIPGIECLSQTLLSAFGALGLSKLNAVQVFKPVTKNV